MTHWHFFNSFSSKIFNSSRLKIVGIQSSQKEFCKIWSDQIKINNTEIINSQNNTFQISSLSGNLNIIENDWKHPFPSNFIPNFFTFMNLKMTLCDEKNKEFFIEEFIKTNIHSPSPYEITCKYRLMINGNYIESKKVRGFMNYKTLNMPLISNNEGKKLLVFVESQLTKK